MIIPLTSRDFNSTFSSIKDLIAKLEPRAEVSLDKANVESIIAKVLAGCVDTLSYNQDANILEAFPSTAINARSAFDLLSIVGYTPKTARACHLSMTLYNPSHTNSVIYDPFSKISVENFDFYSPDSFECAKGVVTQTDWYQGEVVTPNSRPNSADAPIESDNFVDYYYPNLSASVIENDIYVLPTDHVDIDSRTIRIFTEDGKLLTYVENPYMTNITKSSFSIYPSVNSTGYTLRFSKDVSQGVVSKNLYYFYVRAGGDSVGSNSTVDFSDMSEDSNLSFSYNYVAEDYKSAETAADARENIVYEFGWRDTPKAIVTKYDAERAILQDTDNIAAVDVRDGNDYSKADSSKLNVHVFIKLTEKAEIGMSISSAIAFKNKIISQITKFKILPLSIYIHIDDIITNYNPSDDLILADPDAMVQPDSEDEPVTKMYGWFPDITVYLKEQVNAQEAGAILYQINEALFERYKYSNCNFNEVPRIVDIIDTVQNATDMILYLDIDGVYYQDMKTGDLVSKETVTGNFTTAVDAINEDDVYTVTLDTLEQTRKIQYHTVKIVDANNVAIGYDNGDGVIMSDTGYLKDYGSIDYTTGELNIEFAYTPNGSKFYVYHKLEDPTFCKFINNSNDNIKVALESIKA